MSEQPEPCPFCDTHLEPHNAGGTLSWWAHPGEPKCPANRVELFEDGEITAWNTRAPSRPEQVGWRPMDELADDDTIVLAGCPDGRIMVWRANILLRNLRGPTPEHLKFPATGWMPLPAPPSIGETKT